MSKSEPKASVEKGEESIAAAEEGGGGRTPAGELTDRLVLEAVRVPAMNSGVTPLEIVGKIGMPLAVALLGALSSWSVTRLAASNEKAATAQKYVELAVTILRDAEATPELRKYGVDLLADHDGGILEKDDDLREKLESNVVALPGGPDNPARQWLTDFGWADVTLTVVREPSGLSPTSYNDLVLAVGDSTAGVYFLKLLPKGRIGFLRLVSFKGDRTGEIDLEGICFDDSGTYYALGSHRDELSRVLLSFSIDVSRLMDSDYTLETSAIPLQAALEECLSKHALEVDGETIELEGIAYHSSRKSLFIGAKNPERGGGALLFEYVFATKECRLHRVALRSDTSQGSSMGINGLTVADEKILIAANPLTSYGKSEVFEAQPSAGASGSWTVRPLFHAGEPDLKLEGLAAVGDQLCLAYEQGDKRPKLRWRVRPR